MPAVPITWPDVRKLSVQKSLQSVLNNRVDITKKSESWVATLAGQHLNGFSSKGPPVSSFFLFFFFFFFFFFPLLV